MKTTKRIYGTTLALMCGLVATTLKAQNLYVANFSNNTIGEYGLDGSTVNASLISGLSRPSGIAISSQNDLYVANYATGIPGGPGSVGEYGLDGSTVNASLISGLTYPSGIGFARGTMVLLNFSERLSTYGGTLGEYGLNGSTINASLVSLNYLNPAGLAIYGNIVFAVTEQGVGEYSINPTEGPTINASLITGLSDPTGIAIGEDVLFVASGGADGTIGEYGFDGSVINASLITGLNSPTGIAILGNALYVANSGSGTIGEYTLSGQTVNASLISGLSGPWGLAISPVPEPSAGTLAGAGAAVLWVWRRRK